METFEEIKNRILDILNKISVSALKLTTGNAVHDAIGIACTVANYKKAIEYRENRGDYDKFSNKEKGIIKQICNDLVEISRRAQTITTQNIEQEKVLLSNFIKSVIKYYET